MDIWETFANVSPYTSGPVPVEHRANLWFLLLPSQWRTRSSPLSAKAMDYLLERFAQQHAARYECHAGGRGIPEVPSCPASTHLANGGRAGIWFLNTGYGVASGI